MKKTLSAIILISLGLMVFVPIQAATPTEGVLESCLLTVDGAKLTGCPVSPLECNFENDPECGMCCFLQTLYKVTDWFFVILVALAGIFVVMGSMNLLMSGGDPSKVTSGRNYVIYAIIGLIVGFLAKAIPAIVKLSVGG